MQKKGSRTGARMRVETSAPRCSWSYEERSLARSLADTILLQVARSELRASKKTQDPIKVINFEFNREPRAA